MPSSKQVIANRKLVIEKRHRQYARACKLCRDGQKAGYYPSRCIVFGSAVWTHDSVHPCKAAVLREKHWREDHPDEK